MFAAYQVEMNQQKEKGSKDLRQIDHVERQVVVDWYFYAVRVLIQSD